MSYQYNQSNTYQSFLDTSACSTQAIDTSSSAANSNTSDSSRSINLGSIGDIITGTVLQTGDTPIVAMNGTPVQVRSDVLNSVKPGDQIYLRITGSTSSEITLKLVSQEEMSVTSSNGAMQTEILKNTAQFVEHLTQSQSDQNPSYQEFSKEAVLLSNTMTTEEKAKLRQMGIDVSSANLTVVKNLLSQMRGQEQESELQQAIAGIRKQILIENPSAAEDMNLNIGDSSLDMQQFTEEANKLLPIREDQTTYLVQNNSTLTMENLYKSEYTGMQRPERHVISDSAMEQLRPQIERTIQTAGLQVDSDSMQAASFLLDRQLPLTSDSLKLYLAIQDINANGFSASSLTALATDYIAQQRAITTDVAANPSQTAASSSTEAIDSSTADTVASTNRTSDTSGQTNPADVLQLRKMNLYFPTASKVADQIAEDLSNITDEGLYAYANTGLPFTLENLSRFCATNSGMDTDTFPAQGTAAMTAAITAHRQLEEIRLKMTWDASYSLATEDIQIRAKELTQVVEALKNQERDYYKQQFLADDILPSKENLKLVEDTNSKMQELPGLPASCLAPVLFSGSVTINRLYERGIQDISSVTDTSATKLRSYETLMTAPRRDMGDSLQKAFRNVDDLLEEMNLPATEDNQRAVRILGYNQMELSEDSITRVKAADQSVQELIQNMQPSVVLHMVQDGINPLDMPITELNELAQDYIQEQDLADEGRYSEFLQRLDRKGAISAEDRKGYIGVYRLLDKVVKSKGKDIGTVLRNGQTMTLQNLLTAHRSNRSTGMDTSVDDSFGALSSSQMDTSISDDIQNAAQYNQGLAEKLMNHMTPDIIEKMTSEAAEGATLEEFFDTIQEQIIDELDGELQSQSDNTDTQNTPELMMNNPEFLEVELADYQFMKEMNIFPSMTNIFMSKEIRQGSNQLYHSLADSSDAIQEHLSHMEDHLTSAQEMENTYQELEQQKSDEVYSKEETGTITALDIQSLKMIRSGLKVLQKMSRQSQFQIPFSVNGEWNIINLSLIEGGDTKGSIQADIHTSEYGTISTNLTWNKDHFEGSYYADSETGTDFLNRHTDAFTDGLEEITKPVSDASATSEPSTAQLYDMSKKLITFIKHIMTA